MTQWVVGMAGPVGLNYTSVMQVMDLLAVPDRLEVFDAVRVMEAEALDVLASKR